MYSGMAMRSNYDISKLSEYSGRGIEMIRITAHDYDIRDGMDFAREVKARGYKLSINPINIMGYADKDILWILDQVNAILPYQFSLWTPLAACGGGIWSASSAWWTTTSIPASGWACTCTRTWRLASAWRRSSSTSTCSGTPPWTPA